MSSERSTRWMLGLGALGLAVGGVLVALDQDTASRVLFTAVAVAPVLPLVGEIVEKLRRRQPGVDVIAIIAVGASLGLGEFLTAAIIGLMLATGRFLEEYAAGRAERELTALLSRAPREAHRVFDGEIEVVAIDQVARGDRLMIMAGEVVPVDGVVLGQPALVDESALTGEPLPVERKPGDLVSSGAVNAADVFEVLATADAEHSTYAGIVRLVQEARQSRAPSVRLADRWAGWFVPLALGTAGAAWAFSGDPVRGLAVLVVATPCPLLLAVPIAVVSGISRAAHRGIVFRGGGALEMLAQIRNLLIDKTGTVTVGQPALRSVAVLAGDRSEDEILRAAASVDQTSNHVLARAIVEAARHRDLDLEMPVDVSEVSG
ncbi:MAG TPA: HAD-IC family P-type ATPase, partial [Acidimicrobiia bacterium]